MFTEGSMKWRERKWYGEGEVGEEKGSRANRKEKNRQWHSLVILTVNGQWMPYNFVIDSIHTKKLCSRFSSKEVRFYTENGYFAFWAPSGRGLRDNVRCSSWAHWKARSGLPISDKRTFFARCYVWGATSENRLKVGVFEGTVSVWQKISGTRRRP